MNQVAQVAQVIQFRPQQRDSRSAVLDHAANELIFAVVGHVGSGTSEVAKTLESLLKTASGGLPAHDVQVFKASDLISEWAVTVGKEPPALVDGKKTLQIVETFQDLGDDMRKNTADFAAVARAFAVRIRKRRAECLGLPVNPNEPIVPDGSPRAYILDSIRHPAEVELLRHIYQDAFVLVGVVCEESTRLKRVTSKYPDAGKTKALEFMRRDAKAVQKHGQRVSDAFHLSDFFLDNTEDRYRDDGSANPDWDVPDRLSRLVKIIRHAEIVRTAQAETAMHHARAAALRSACLSRQVGAALLDRTGNVIATGCNEVPRAGGGVYGESFDKDDADDHRCAYRRVEGHTKPYCSNSLEQTEIVNVLLQQVAEIAPLDEEQRAKLQASFRSGAIGSLLEFSRAVHAEMDAILTAGRSGTTTVGTRLFVTTFPCHYCARHIVSAGIDEVQYIEPYPKSQALDLHSDSIQVTATKWTVPSHFSLTRLVTSEAPTRSRPKVLFRPFTGVAPRLYGKAFAKDRELKDGTSGELTVGQPDWGSPWHLRRSSYAQLEAELAEGTDV
ncbi:MAG: anti-phage dCTP deaminase [Pseudomonadota bacterium]